jgi:hypothetical protein
MKKKEYKNISNPEQVICMLIYEKPLDVSDICLKMYGKKRNSKVTKWLSDLVKKKWIQQIISNNPDLRYTYYQASSKCFLDHITQMLNENDIELDGDENSEKKKLRNFLNSEPFRFFISENIPSEYTIQECPAIERPNFSKVIFIISFYSIYIDTLEKYISEVFGKTLDKNQIKKFEEKEILPFARDIGKGRIMDLENVDKKLRMTINKLFREEDKFLSEFLKLDVSLRKKIIYLQPTIQRNFLKLFLSSTASFADELR